MAGRKQATMTSTALLLLGLLAMAAVAPAAAGSTVCRVNLDAVEGACTKYCVRGSKEAWPSKECCNAVRGADFKCACRWKRLIGRYTGNIDARRAMQVPSKCGIPGAPTSC